jgi:hypothetical protein
MRSGCPVSVPSSVLGEKGYRQMANRNPYDGHCSICGSQVRAHEGVAPATDSWPFYEILCPEHAPQGALDPPKPVEVSKLPSIHKDYERFER